MIRMNGLFAGLGRGHVRRKHLGFPVLASALTLGILFGGGRADARTIYVDNSIKTGGNGTNWGNAYKYLRDALEASASGDEIWVAQGTYYPDEGKTGLFGDREQSFDLNIDGLRIYGGFDGSETRVGQRDPEANPTILSGKIWQGAGEEIFWSLHVIKATQSVLLDGLTVTGGNANGSLSWAYPNLPEYDRGGGCYLSGGATLRVNDCIFIENRAIESGGAVMIVGGSGKVVATNSRFEDNGVETYFLATSSGTGGAVSGDVDATDCEFIDNFVIAEPSNDDDNSIGTGGAIAGDVDAVDCRFEGNSVTSSAVAADDSTAIGGAIAGAVDALNCEFIGNSAETNGGDAIVSGGAISGPVSLKRCRFDNNSAIANASATDSICSGGAIDASSAAAVSCWFSANESGVGFAGNDGPTRGSGGGGAFHISGGNSTITNCVFVANITQFRGGAVVIDADPEENSLIIANSTFVDNGAGNEGAAVLCEGVLRIVNNIFWNTATTGSGVDLTNLIQVVETGVLRNTDLNYPTPSGFAQNVVNGGIASVTSIGGSDRYLGVTSDTLVNADPLFVDVADPDGPDDIFGTLDDGLRISAGSAALGTARDPDIDYRSFVPLDVQDVDDDNNFSERLPSDIARFVRIQDDYVDMGAYEFGDIQHVPDIELSISGGSPLVSGSSSVNFGTANGKTVTRNFTIKNVGLSNLNDLQVSLTGAGAANFSAIQPGNAPVVPGGAVGFSVTYKPLADGDHTATLRVASDDPDENPFTVTLNGSGLVPDIAVEYPSGTGLVDGKSTVSFGDVPVKSTSGRVFTIRNTGKASLTLGTISVKGNNKKDFSVGRPGKLVIPAGGSTTLVVSANPAKTGSTSATLSIKSSDPDAEAEFTVTLKTKGIIAPDIQVSQPPSNELASGATRSFGSVKLGLTYAKTFTIKNSGTSTLKDIKVKLSGATNHYTLTKSSVKKLKPGETTKFTVSFKPKSSGSFTAKVKISSNDADENPFNIDITGSGVAKSAKVRKSSLLDEFEDLFATRKSAKGVDAIASTVKSSDGQRYKVLVVKKGAGWNDSKHSVQVSSNLLDWFSGKKHTTVLVDNDKILKVRDNTPVTKGSKRFIRLK
ncbi:MAG: choice-of-anchor D domain-containing protein [Akkermansiaceae bacterium]|nr:choice-of-anchor D domain-containing protein [Akkermansiaceae bacterium]